MPKLDTSVDLQLILECGSGKAGQCTHAGVGTANWMTQTDCAHPQGSSFWGTQGFEIVAYVLHVTLEHPTLLPCSTVLPHKLQDAMIIHIVFL